MKSKMMLIVLLVGTLLVGCKNQENIQATEDVISAVYTEAVSTLNAGMTLTAAFATPTATHTTTPTITLTTTPTHTALAVTHTAVTGGGLNLSQCDVAGFVSDVTIPDGAAVAPGTTFTKTWRIKNDGTCTWNPNYKIVYYSGERLNTNPNYPLTAANVAPGESIEISIDMVAPTTPGNYTSNWILQNASGQYFGIGSGGGVLYVQFVVNTQGSATPTTTPQPSQTAAPTDTSTPEPSPTATQQ